MKMYDFSPFTLPDRFLKARGLAISSATQTEGVINHAIAGLAHVDFMVGGALTTHMPMTLKFSVLYSLAELAFSDRNELAEFDLLIDRIKNAFERRNSIAHDQWATDQADNSLVWIKESSRAQYTFEVHVSTLEEMEKDALELYDCGMELQSFLSRKGLNPIIPDTYRQKAHANNADRRRYKKNYSKPQGDP